MQIKIEAYTMCVCVCVFEEFDVQQTVAQPIANTTLLVLVVIGSTNKLCLIVDKAKG